VEEIMGNSNSGFQKGNIPWNKGKSGYHTGVQPMLGKHHSKETKDKMSVSHKEQWNRPGYRERVRKIMKKVGEKMRLPHGESNFNFIYGSYKYAAKKRGLDWQLSKGEFRLLTSGDCWYCGATPSNTHSRSRREYGQYPYNGIDRIDNKVGYIYDNCVACCKQCNYAKGVMTITEFKVWLRAACQVSIGINEPTVFLSGREWKI